MLHDIGKFGISVRAETNTSICEYLIILVVFVNTILVSNTRYIFPEFYIKK